MEKKQQFSLWYFVITLLILLTLQSFLFAPHTENISYSDFKMLLKAGKVGELVIGERVISGCLKSEGLEGLLPKEQMEQIQQLGKEEHRFVTFRVDDLSLLPELEAANIRFTGRVENTWFTTLLSWILPALIFFGLWGFFLKRIGAASGVMEIRKLLTDAYGRVKETLTTRRQVLEALAKLLLVKEVIDREILIQVISHTEDDR